MATTNPYGKSIKVPLKTKDFDKLIWDQGIKVRHDKTAQCPNCFDKETGHYDINCNICENGKISFDSKDVWVLFYQKKMEEVFNVAGVWELGDVLMTAPALYEDGEVVRIDYYDRITLLDFSERTSDLVRRAQSGDTDLIRYEVLDVQLLRTKTITYEKEVDFQIIDTNIKWISANRPTAGEIYSLAYLYRPVYRVIQFFHESRYYYDSYKNTDRVATYLPIQAQMRRDYTIDDRKNYD